MFDFQATHLWYFSGGSNCSELLVFLYLDRLSHFYLSEAVVLLSVAIDTSLMIIGWSGEGSLDVLVCNSFEGFGTYKLSEVWDGWWKFIGEEGADFTAQY